MRASCPAGPIREDPVPKPREQNPSQFGPVTESGQNRWRKASAPSGRALQFPRELLSGQRAGRRAGGQGCGWSVNAVGGRGVGAGSQRCT